MRLQKLKLSSFALSLWVVGYIFLLNLFTNTWSTLHYAIGGALALLFVTLLFEKTPQIVFKTILSFFVLLASVTIFYKYNFNIVMTGSIVLSIFVNNAAVNFEMLSKSFFFWVLLTGLLPVFLIFKTDISQKMPLRRLLFTEVGILLLLGVWLKAIGYEWHRKGEIRDPKLVLATNYFSPVDTLVSMQKAWRYYKKLKHRYAHITKLTDIHRYRSLEENLTVVLVIGESTRGDHFQINGYDRKTTPHLAKEKNLISFPHVQSCDTITLRSLPCMLSPLSMYEKGRIPHEGSFVDIFRKLGYYTSIFSLQGLNDLYNYMGYDRLLTKYAILKNNRYTTQDMALLPFAKEAIEEDAHPKKLIILHTLGSHNRYIERVPTELVKFKPNCYSSNLNSCTKEAIRNSYDNSILAIDAFIGDLITLLREKKALLIYTSDHGESLGENGIFGHGRPIATAPKAQRNVPMLFWFSDAYKASETGARLFANLQEAKKHMPQISHDDLFYSILGCSDIVSEDGGIDNRLNLCSETLLARSPRTNTAKSPTHTP